LTARQHKAASLKPWLAALLAVFSAAVRAAPPAQPNAGSILQQVQPPAPEVPSSNGTGLSIEQQGGANLPPSPPFEVKNIQISGNTLFGTAILHARVADGEGKTITLSELGNLAARITDYYHDHGYPLARAIVPAQTIQDGVVRLEVIEARYGKIALDNRSRVSDALLQATLAALQSGQIIAQADIDRVLLLLSDVPGMEVNATLAPGEAVGTSDLTVAATPAPDISGNAALDNYGNRYIGRVRASVSANFYNPLHHGDNFSFSGLTSGNGMRYANVAYATLLDGRGTRLGASYSSLSYALGDTLAALDAHGTAQVASLWLRHPWVRGGEVNLYAQLEYDHKTLRDHTDAASPPVKNDRHMDNWTAGLSGDLRDAWLSGGINTWSMGVSAGRVGFDDAAAGANDAAAANTRGGFIKWNVTASRLQALDQENSLYLNFAGQGANGNLDPSEKMSVGGPYSVRAYGMGAVSGDAGYNLSIELRRELGGQWQATAFVDDARVTVNKSTWVAGTNSATLTGVGAGLNWTGANQWRAKASIAVPLGATSQLAASPPSVSAWLEIGRGF
jgi:hemolysin activation/secretion protein